MAQRENHFITLMVAWLCLMTAGAPHGKTNASGPLRRPGLESSGGFLTYTSGTCARMTGKLGSAGTLAGVSTWSFQTAWASPQHGSLRMLALLTWQVRTLRANVPAKKLELWGLLELSLRSHTAPLLLHSTGQSHHELAQIQGRGHRPHLSSGRVPNNLKLPPPPPQGRPVTLWEIWSWDWDASGYSLWVWGCGRGKPRKPTCREKAAATAWLLRALAFLTVVSVLRWSQLDALCSYEIQPWILTVNSPF